jgi:proteasome lid subunit RPN8/RPN11
VKKTVRSRRKVYGQLLKHARRQPHRECCGILAGQDGLITQAFPAKNVAADPIRNYEIAPKEIVRLMGELRKRRLEFLGLPLASNWLDTERNCPKTSCRPTILNRSGSSSRPGRTPSHAHPHFNPAWACGGWGF